jgi:putative ubiquitin-RnfH superfamily antitoxin RatB of RatAB toxin-antitoxin module
MDSKHSDGETISIEVVFAAPDRQKLVTINMAAGASVAHSIAASGLATEFPDYRFENLEFGIWGRMVSADHPLLPGDRVEIYRPLAIDPREARRNLALEGRSMGHTEEDL